MKSYIINITSISWTVLLSHQLLILYPFSIISFSIHSIQFSSYPYHLIHQFNQDQSLSFNLMISIHINQSTTIIISRSSLNILSVPQHPMIIILHLIMILVHRFYYSIQYQIQLLSIRSTWHLIHTPHSSIDTIYDQISTSFNCYTYSSSFYHYSNYYQHRMINTAWTRLYYSSYSICTTTHRLPVVSTLYDSFYQYSILLIPRPSMIILRLSIIIPQPSGIIPWLSMILPAPRYSTHSVESIHTITTSPYSFSSQLDNLHRCIIYHAPPDHHITI